MQLHPAIDLRSGRVVRLKRGDDRQRTTYDVDPRAVLARYADAGVAMAHVVDLDAALGDPPQRGLLEELLDLSRDGTRAPRIQLGGGLRDRAAVEWAFSSGCERVVVTSLLERAPEVFAELCDEYPGRMVPALDCEGGELKVDGWTRASGRSLDEVSHWLSTLDIGPVLVTDIARDGMMQGPNIPLAARMAQRCATGALLSGGVRSTADLEAAAREPSIAGAIVGRALYDGDLELGAALRACRASGSGPNDGSGGAQ